MSEVVGLRLGLKLKQGLFTLDAESDGPGVGREFRYETTRFSCRVYDLRGSNPRGYVESHDNVVVENFRLFDQFVDVAVVE